MVQTLNKKLPRSENLKLKNHILMKPLREHRLIYFCVYFFLKEKIQKTFGIGTVKVAFILYEIDRNKKR